LQPNTETQQTTAPIILWFQQIKYESSLNLYKKAQNDIKSNKILLIHISC